MLGVQDTIFILEGEEGSVGPHLTLKGRGWAYLASSVHDLRGIVLAVVLDDPAEGVLDCGVIAFNKVMFDKADGQRRLSYRMAYPSKTDDGEKEKGESDFIPTERLPTIAIFLCFGAAGMLDGE